MNLLLAPIRIAALMLVAAALLLGGCGTLANTEFDNIEASRYSDISVAAAILGKHCSSTTEIQQNLPELLNRAEAAKGYSSIKASNSRMAEAGNIILGLVSDLNTRYTGSVPSDTYCKLKLTEISKASERVARSVAKKEIQSPLSIQ